MYVDPPRGGRPALYTIIGMSVKRTLPEFGRQLWFRVRLRAKKQQYRYIVRNIKVVIIIILNKKKSLLTPLDGGRAPKAHVQIVSRVLLYNS